MKQKKSKARALVLFSGGLDSLLAVKILQAQEIEAVPVCFESHFFSCGNAKEYAKKNGMELRVEDISAEHLKIVKSPRYGRGAGANPCIDCHLLMIQTAGKIMAREGFDFIATGEVMGQRPMSQNKLSLSIIAQKSGLTDKILRPLSAKLLPPIAAEKDGLVDRAKLYDFSGRSRRPQLALAKLFGIKHIPQPGGGCVLTDPEYGRQLKLLMRKIPDFTGADARLLRLGRVMWQDNLLIMAARDQNDCRQLEKAAKKGDWLFAPQNFPGATVLIRDFGQKKCLGETSPHFREIKRMGQDFVLRYSKKLPADAKIKIIG